MSTMSFIASMKVLSNTKSVVRFEPGHHNPTYRFDPACFWAGFEADVKRLRKEHDIASRQFDLWVESAIQRGLHVEWNPKRELTPQEEREFQAFWEKIDADWETIKDRRTAEYHRLMSK